MPLITVIVDPTIISKKGCKSTIDTVSLLSYVDWNNLGVQEENNNLNGFL